MWRRPALAVSALATLVVVLAAAVPVDEALHDLAFRHLVGHELRLLANGLTALGTTWAGAGVLGGLAVVGYRVRDGVLLRGAAGGLIGLAAGGVVSQVVKHVACRARPRLVEGWGVGVPGTPDDPAARGFFHWPCFGEPAYHGFPSGHATTAFTLAAALCVIAPAGRRAWLLAAAGVGASRVVLNAHFLSDVVGGALIGWWVGQLGLLVAARLGQPSGPGHSAAPADAPTRAA
jgi:membrane-associated phospholipid phosphatase